VEIKPANHLYILG